MPGMVKFYSVEPDGNHLLMEFTINDVVEVNGKPGVSFGAIHSMMAPYFTVSDIALPQGAVFAFEITEII